MLDVLDLGPEPDGGAAWSALTGALETEPSGLRVQTHGFRRLILTAPHGAAHPRAGQLLRAETAAAAVAELLAGEFAATSITTSGQSVDDPNWDATPGPFKTALGTAIRPRTTVLDVHLMQERPGIDICIGRGPLADRTTENLAELARRLGVAMGLRISIDAPFAARGPNTITRFAQERGARALQIELGPRVTPPGGDPATIARTLDWLRRVAALADAAPWT